MYFRNFPTVGYKFGLNEKPTAFVDLSAYSNVLDNLADAASFYSFYTIQDGDRPDIISHKLYGTTEYYWVFYLLNPQIRLSGWPLSQAEMTRYLDEKYPGVCLVAFGNELGSDTDFRQIKLIERFPIGGTVVGLVSGATGVVYARNVNLGQMFVRKTNNLNFIEGEAVVDKNPDQSYVMPIHIVHDPAYLATHHYEDGEGIHIDVDYSVDFRGRGPEDPPALGGVVGDNERPDVYALTSPYTNITIYEYVSDLNLDLSRIKVVKPNMIGQFAQIFKNALSK